MLAPGGSGQWFTPPTTVPIDVLVSLFEYAEIRELATKLSHQNMENYSPRWVDCHPRVLSRYCSFLLVLRSRNTFYVLILCLFNAL